MLTIVVLLHQPNSVDVIIKMFVAKSRKTKPQKINDSDLLYLYCLNNINNINVPKHSD